MAYELEPRPIGPRRRPRLTIAAGSAFAAAVVVAAWLGRAPAAPAHPAPPPVVALVAPTGRSLPTPGIRWRPAGPDPTLPPPGRVDCTDVPRLRCADVVAAARVVVVALGARPVAATVYSSLVCGSYRDCPRSLISDAQPLGSVVIRFDDRRETWVNVVRPRADPPGTVVQPEARVVRWTTWSG